MAARILAGTLFTFVSILGAASADPKLDLHGKVTGAAPSRMRTLRVTLFSVDKPFTTSTFTDPGGEFHFHGVPAGTYTLSILRRSLGEIRRTVVVTSSLADRKGAIRVSIPYSAGELANSRTGGQISKKQLIVPDSAIRYYQEAQQRLARHDVDGARKSLDKAVTRFPQFSAAWNSLGVIAYQTGDSRLAEEEFRKALTAEPGAYEPTVNLGGVLLGTGRWKEALEYNGRAVDMRPKDALSNAQVGINYYELGDFDRAEPALLAAERADPSHFSRPQLFLARIYLNRGQREDARREVEDCLARHPDDADAKRMRGMLAGIEAPDEATSSAPATP